MENYNHDNGSGIFIQVGAGAGDLDKRANCRDGFTEFIKSLPRDRIKKLILVEPNPLNIPLLKECWKDYSQAVIYEIGIVPKNYQKNTMDLYYCPQDEPHYQVASINISHVHDHYGNGCEIEKFVIDVKCIEDLISDVCNISNEEIELISLDIEGLDAEVLLDIDFNNINVKYISFEQNNSGEYENETKNYLENMNYSYLGKGCDYQGHDLLYVKNIN
jgi:hypothetical protein